MNSIERVTSRQEFEEALREDQLAEDNQKLRPQPATQGAEQRDTTEENPV